MITLHLPAPVVVVNQVLVLPYHLVPDFPLDQGRVVGHVEPERSNVMKVGLFVANVLV
jgi:hypothetical protein